VVEVCLELGEGGQPDQSETVVEVYFGPQPGKGAGEQLDQGL